MKFKCFRKASYDIRSDECKQIKQLFVTHAAWHCFAGDTDIVYCWLGWECTDTQSVVMWERSRRRPEGPEAARSAFDVGDECTVIGSLFTFEIRPTRWPQDKFTFFLSRSWRRARIRQHIIYLIFMNNILKIFLIWSQRNALDWRVKPESQVFGEFSTLLMAGSICASVLWTVKLGPRRAKCCFYNGVASSNSTDLKNWSPSSLSFGTSLTLSSTP